MNQSGFSLIEITLSLFLGSLILLSLSKLYLLGKNEYQKTENILNEHLELIWINDLLTHSIRHAGFTPCFSIDQLELVDEKGIKRVIPKIYVEQNSQSSIHINRMNEQFALINDIISPTQLLIAHKKFLNEKHPILIVDCEHAEIHHIAKITKFFDSWKVTLTRPLFYTYNTATYLGEWMEESWFLQENKKKKKSLYYKLIESEEMSALINSFTAQVKEISGHQFVELVMGLDNSQAKRILVGVRA